MGICAFIDMWHWFSVVVFQRSVVDWGRGYICHGYTCILLYVTLNSRNVKSATSSANMSSNSRHVKLPFLTTRCQYILLYVTLIWCSGVSEIYGQFGGRGICAFFFMWHWFSVVVFQRSMVNWGIICHGYMCILLYVKLIWCSGVPEIYGQLGGTSTMGICAFFYMWNLFGVVVFQRSMVNLGGWSATSSANISSNSRNVKSVTSSANMSSNSRNLKLTFLTTRCQYWGLDLPIHLPTWALTVWSATFGVVVFKGSMVNWGGRSASRSGTSSANMSSHSRNVKSPFLTTRCQYGGFRSARGVDLPPGLPKLSVCEMADLLSLSPYSSTLTVEMLKLPVRCTGRSTRG